MACCRLNFGNFKKEPIAKFSYIIAHARGCRAPLNASPAQSQIDGLQLLLNVYFSNYILRVFI
ncbi:hypothetical protein A3J90_00550 [candidate division WOR-1 bacterium RIFOXYC2_FULL_37_10]|nr:MAG: hypothetical protein A3J90_00550 [candidate division WOR-1 bacterium RIFOXYC2_FULL_37_10]